MTLTARRLDLLAAHLTNRLGVSHEKVLEALQDWVIDPETPEPPAPKTLTFQVIALYDKGFGPECMNLPNITVDAESEAQCTAERIATEMFYEKFRGKVEWQEVKIRPVK